MRRVDRRHTGNTRPGSLCGVLACALLAGPWTACHAETRAVEPTEAVALQLLEQLDAAMASGDEDTYTRLFAPRVPLLPGSACLRSALVLRSGTSLAQSSTLDGFLVLDDRPIGVMLFHSDVACSSAPDEKGMTQHAYMAFTTEGGATRALLHVDVNPHARRHVSDQFTGAYACPACNFEIGSRTLSDWLVVPTPKLASGCIEMVSFHRLGADLKLTISINHNLDQLDAGPLLQRLLTERRLASAAFRPVPWELPSARDKNLPGVLAAQCDLSSTEDGLLVLRLVTRRTTPASGAGAETRKPGEGREEISYLLVTRGTGAAAREHRGELDTLLSTFRITEPKRCSTEVGRAAAQAHGGGVLGDDQTYRNPLHRIAFAGPPDWRAVQQADRGLFRVTYDCPEARGTIILTGYPTGPGGLLERQGLIVKQLRRCLDERSMAPEPLTWSEATDTATDGLRSSLHVESREPGQTESVPRTLCEVLLFDDMWLALEGTVRHEAAVAAFEAVLASVRRL